MGQLIDLVGKRFGRLVVLKKTSSITDRARWVCRCDCGTEVIIISGSLLQEKTKSCGCLRAEKSRFNLEKSTKIWVEYNNERLSALSFVKKYRKVSFLKVRARVKAGWDYVSAATVVDLPERPQQAAA